MRRHILGILGLVMVGAGIVTLVSRGDGDLSKMLSSENSMFASILIRAGLTTCAIWLAFPQLELLSKTIPPWVVGAFALGVIALAAGPPPVRILVLVMLGMVGAIQFIKWMFKPPAPKKK